MEREVFSEEINALAHHLFSNNIWWWCILFIKSVYNMILQLHPLENCLNLPPIQCHTHKRENKRFLTKRFIFINCREASRGDTDPICNRSACAVEEYKLYVFVSLSGMYSSSAICHTQNYLYLPFNFDLAPISTHLRFTQNHADDTKYNSPGSLRWHLADEFLTCFSCDKRVVWAWRYIHPLHSYSQQL